MVVVPDDAALLVEAHVANQDVGFLRPGQPAEIKIETFAFTRYGLIHGTVLDVSRDAVAPNLNGLRGDEGKANQVPPRSDSGGFVTHLSLERNSMTTESGVVPLGPGMSVTAEIKTGQRSVISYLLSPVLRYRQESLRER